MSDTPRTDKAETHSYSEDVTGCSEAAGVVSSELARELERELNSERARLDYILRVCSAGVFYNVESRETIDAEMKEEIK